LKNLIEKKLTGMLAFEKRKKKEKRKKWHRKRKQVGKSLGYH
jgi:hypothetical protein